MSSNMTIEYYTTKQLLTLVTNIYKNLISLTKIFQANSDSKISIINLGLLTLSYEIKLFILER